MNRESVVFISLASFCIWFMSVAGPSLSTAMLRQRARIAADGIEKIIYGERVKFKLAVPTNCKSRLGDIICASNYYTDTDSLYWATAQGAMPATVLIKFYDEKVRDNIKNITELETEIAILEKI